MQIKKYILSLVFVLGLSISTTSFSLAQTNPATTLPEGGSTGNIDKQEFSTYTALTCIPYLTKNKNSEGKCTVPLNTASSGGLNSLLAKSYNIGIGIAIALTILRIVYGGFLYSTVEAAGRKSDAKKIIQNSLLGLLLALGSWLLLNLISPDLTKFALNITKVDVKTINNLNSGAPVTTNPTNP